MIQKILNSKNPKLRMVSKPAGKIDKKVKDLIQDLKDTLKIQKDPEGVGLAAPQIGKNLRVFFVNHEGLARIVINPEILAIKTVKTKKKKADSDSTIMEGCLSLPHYYGPLKRANRVKVKYLDEDGVEVVEEFKDFAAQIILHEIDHLNGYLFVDRLIEQDQPLYVVIKSYRILR
ncbi:peptide deformylase [Candidatus Woesebacteria bacterium]|nr:peptide deformylase [Candidatus Woesebacteria bacterium]